MTICAIVLAAGTSQRMGDVNKLTALVDGEALVRKAVSALRDGGVDRIIVVTGFESAAVGALLSDINDLEVVHNPDYQRGMGGSLAIGTTAIDSDDTAVLVALGDMASIAPSTIAALIAAHRRSPGAAIAPIYGDQRGHPVLFPASARTRLAALEGDSGARTVYRSHTERVEVVVGDSGVVRDIDTPSQLQDARQREPILACAFDAYGTLFDVSGGRHLLTAALDRDRGEAILTLWRQKQLQYTWLRALTHTHVDFWRLTGEALDYAMETQRVSDPPLRKQLLEHYRSLPADADAVDTLTALRESGVRTGILSNGEPRMLADAVRAAKLDDLLDEVISVEEVGVYKPDPRVYQLGVDRLAAPKDGLAFVTANAWDAAGGAVFGLQVVWINRAGQPRERLPGEPRAVVSSLAGLAGALGL